MIRKTVFLVREFIIALLVLLIKETMHPQNDNLRAEMNALKSELASLQHVVDALNTGDSSYSVYFPAWTVLDRKTKLSIFSAFKNRGRKYDAGDDVCIIVTPDKQDIVDIRIGNSSYGRLFAQSVLDPDLKRELLERNYAHVGIVPEGYKNDVRDVRNPVSHPDAPQWVGFNLSAFGGFIRFSNEWGIVGKVGDDELGYPFWSSGQVRMMLQYKSIKLGSWLPLHGGLSETPIAGPLALRPRLLNGSGGITGEFEFEWDEVRLHSSHIPYGAVGGMFSVGGLTYRRPEYLTSNLDSLYSISTVLQAYYAFDYLFDGGSQGLNVHVGMSYHRVSLNRETHGEVIPAGPPQQFIDPMISVEYKSQRTDWFKVSAQYSRLLMLGGWAEIVPYFVYAEVKYSAIVGRSPQPWEYPSYLYGTIGFSFDF